MTYLSICGHQLQISFEALVAFLLTLFVLITLTILSPIYYSFLSPGGWGSEGLLIHFCFVNLAPAIGLWRPHKSSQVKIKESNTSSISWTWSYVVPLQLDKRSRRQPRDNWNIILPLTFLKRSERFSCCQTRKDIFWKVRSAGRKMDFFVAPCCPLSHPHQHTHTHTHILT